MDESVTIHLQEMLMNITENKFESILDLIINSIYITSKENLFLLVHNFFIAASCRPKSMMIYSRLLYSLYTLPTSKPTVLKYLPQALKYESQCNQYPPFYFFYCLMKSGFPSSMIINFLVDQFDHSLRKCLINKNMKIFKDDQIFYGYALFAPELIEANKFSWFEYLIEYYKDQQFFFMNETEENPNDETAKNEDIYPDVYFTLSRNVELFIEQFPYLSENDFEKYYEYRDIGWNPDEVYRAIQKDDDAKLDSIFREVGNNDIINFVNKPIQWSPFERCPFLQNDPLPIHVAAFFNSVKCLSYLITQGADLTATDLCGRTVIQFAIAGGSDDLRLLDRHKCSYEGALHIAAKFHRYYIFDSIFSFRQIGKFNIGPKRSSNYNSINNNQISAQTTGGCSTTADTSDIEGDSTVLTSQQPQKPKIKKTEIKTRSGNNTKPTNKPKTESKPKTSSKSKNSFIIGVTNSMALNGPQNFLTSNIKGLGSVLHQASLSNCIKVLTSLLPKPNHRYDSDRLSPDFDLNYFVNEQASTEKVDGGFCSSYYSYVKNDTPLIVAIKCHNIESINYLTSLPSIDINAPSSLLLKSPLHVAIKRGYDEIVNILLSNTKIEINSKDVNERTPVFEAVYYMNLDALKILAENDNVDFKVRDKNGKTPSEIGLIMPIDSENEVHYGELIRFIRKCSH